MGHTGEVWSIRTITITTSFNFLLRITYTDPEGAERTWESGERLTRPKGSDIDGVGVVAILRDSSKPDESPRIVLQKQWRPPVNATVIEIPAGLIDPKESPETCAIRELKEECGYVGEVMGGDFGVSPIMFNGKLSASNILLNVCFSCGILLPR
jgi:ADP-ribose pyrophosphatase